MQTHTIWKNHTAQLFLVAVTLVLGLASPAQSSFLSDALSAAASNNEQPPDIVPPPSPFGYGFLAGATPPNGEAAISTWNDIHYMCQFSDPQTLQEQIDGIDPENTVLIGLSVAWQDRSVSCDFNGPWGTAPLFIARIAPLLETFKANRERIFALWLFDEPDVRHGGPETAELSMAIDYLHEQVPDIPVFVNWFSADRNQGLPNADWYSTTKGADPADLASFGKPMFLWWFDNNEDPDPRTMNQRWNRMLDHYYGNADSPIVTLGWCCDNITEPSGFSDNSEELNAYLAHVGLLRKETDQVSRAAYAHRESGSWYLFQRELDNTLTYTNDLIFPEYRPFLIGGMSDYYPSILALPGPQGTWIRLLHVAEDQTIHVSWITPDDSWFPWFQLPGTATERPDAITFQNDTWQAIRGEDGAVYVQQGLFPNREWERLGGQATSPPHFKVVNDQLRVVVFWPDGQAYSREWNGSGWNRWRQE